MQTHKFLYTASIRVDVFLGAISAILLMSTARTAMSNQRGLIINRILEFSAAGATRLYWALALVFAFGLVWVLWSVLTGAYREKFIFLTDKAITVPILYSNSDPVVVRLASIDEISTLTKARTNYRILRIDHPHGRLEIHESVLNSAPLFDRLKRAVIERVETARRIPAPDAP